MLDHNYQRILNIQILGRAPFRYRLGDIVLLGNQALTSILDPNTPFRATIGYEYASVTIKNNKFLDFELLRKLIVEHTEKYAYAIPDPNHLIVHYRGGDRKCVKDTEIEDLASYVSHACTKANLKEVIIVTAFHYANSIGPEEVEILTKYNYDNLNRLITNIQNIGIETSLKTNGKIDEDFCYLANAKHLIPTNGGYSMIAGVCNTHNVYRSFPSTDASILYYRNRGVVHLSKAKIFEFRKWFKKEDKYKRIRLLLSKCSPAHIQPTCSP